MLLGVAVALFDQAEHLKLKRFLVLTVVCLAGGLFAFAVSMLIPFFHSFVIVGLLCWIIVPVAKRYFNLENIEKVEEIEK